MRIDKFYAIQMRKKGCSYNEISKKMRIPKSTLSSWFRDVFFSQEIKKENTDRLKKILAHNISVYNKQRSKKVRAGWVEIQKRSKREIKNISDKDLKLIGTALYWAEGYRKTYWNLAFSNSDPHMIKLMMKYFLRICDVPLSKFRIQMQLYHGIAELSARRYWSTITGVPTLQFTKAMYQESKASKKKRGNTLPYGTIRVRINDVKLVNKIKGWINGLVDSI